MSTRRRLAVWLARAGLGLCLAVELVALHFPTPSGVAGDPEAERSVRGAWTLAADVARWLAERVPDAVGAALSPLVDDKTVHLGLFLGLGLLWAAERRLCRALDARASALMIAVLVVYAALGEASQVLAGRVADPRDLVANVVGAVLGVGAVALGTGALRRRPALVAE